MADTTDQERQEQLKTGNPAVPGGLAGVGGGTIPGGSTTTDKSDNTTNSAPQESNPAGNDAQSDRQRSTSAARNEVTTTPAEHQSQGNLGGRNPGQSQNQPIGDQDATFGDRGKELTDPMTSRAPDKSNK